MYVRFLFARLLTAGAVLGASAEARAQAAPCDAICEAHESAVRAALPNHPDRAARHAALRAVEAEPNRAGEWPDAQIRLNVQQLEIPPHMEPMVMLMVEQPLPNQRAQAAGAAAQSGLARAEAARQVGAEAKSAWTLRKALIAWQQAAEREHILVYHRQLVGQLQEVAARLPANAAAPNRWLALQAERAELDLLIEANAEELQRWTGQLQRLGAQLPPRPLRSDALGVLPTVPEAIALPDSATRAQARWYEAERAALAARTATVAAELAPTWSPGLGVMRMDGMPFGWMATLGLRWPEAPWLAARNLRRVAHLGPQRALLDAERDRQRAAQLRTASDALVRWRAAGKQAAMLQSQLLPLAAQRIQALLPLLASGQTTAFELGSAVHAQLQYELRVVDARASWRLARAEWLAAVDGVGSEPEASAGMNTSRSMGAADSGMGGH